MTTPFMRRCLRAMQLASRRRDRLARLAAAELRTPGGKALFLGHVELMLELCRLESWVRRRYGLTGDQPVG